MRRGLAAALCLWTAAVAAPGAVAADLRDFKSDGCTLFPDGSYYGCCYLHDFAYWPGGTADERKHADEALRACVRDAGGTVVAGIMYLGIRLGGGPGHRNSYRWGFGWPFPYRKDYAPLTPDEGKQVADKTRKLCASIRLDPVTGGYVVGVGRQISAAQATSICPAP